MLLRYAILGLLADGPKHGYAVGKELNRLLNGLWPVNPGQVYATLERLARDELISLAVPPPDSRAPRSGRAGAAGPRAASRRTFALLPAGRRALRRWLDRPVGCALPRSALATRLTLHAWADDTAGILRLLGAQRARCTTLRAITQRARCDAADLVAQAASRHLEVELAWIARVEQVLRHEPRPSRTTLLD